MHCNVAHLPCLTAAWHGSDVVAGCSYMLKVVLHALQTPGTFNLSVLDNGVTSREVRFMAHAACVNLQ